jgi:hypothetical protein
MKFKYSKLLIASSLAAILFALTYCSPNAPSISKEVLIRDRDAGSDPTATDPEAGNLAGSSAPETHSTAATSWLDETNYENSMDNLAPGEKSVTLSEENRDDAAKLQAFEKTGKLSIVVQDALPQQINVVLKIDADTASNEAQLGALSNTPIGQIPMSISSQGTDTIISLDLSATLSNPGVAASLNQLEALSVTYQIKPASQ